MRRSTVLKIAISGLDIGHRQDNTAEPHADILLGLSDVHRVAIEKILKTIKALVLYFAVVLPPAQK